ncbi:GrpB family protein [Salsuginibacillus kocurii]|uniref:GrpB family protein n=1 Tax=Salsuginibacillus kocurii TaxID=427078 RepID=UPI000371D5DC|nr:GrpB family protein [Salsuginibacillus kocurii]
MRIVKVVGYDENWPIQFEQEKKQLQAVLGANVIEVYHIGSTAVPGMKAKPIIDMMGVVFDIQQIDLHTEKMNRLGYEAFGEHGITGRRYFQKGGEARSHHAHIYESGHPAIKRHLHFINYLKEHPEAREEYERLKLQLAEKYSTEPRAYNEGKARWIQGIDRIGED